MADTDSPLSPSDRSTIQRLPERGSAERNDLHSLLDEAMVCHVGFVRDGAPVVIPTIYSRDGDRLLVHGSPASAMLRNLADGIDVCVTVTLVDGIVVARSGFHHSMNYRSAVIFGRAEPVTDIDEKRRALDGFVDHVLPGRMDEVRTHTDKEIKGTTVLALDLAEASVKIRTGPPVDDDEDLAGPAWAGVVPVGLAVGAVELAPDYGGDPEPPPSIRRFIDRRGA